MEEIAGSPLLQRSKSPRFDGDPDPYQLMKSMSRAVLRIHQLGVMHNDLLYFSNVILSPQLNGPQKPVIIDFSRALSPSERSGEANPFRDERQKLFQCLKRTVTAVVALRCFERLFAEKGDSIEWRSFLLDMDERELKEWQPLGEADWYMAKLVDYGDEEGWNAR